MMPATPAWPPQSLPRLFIDQPMVEGGEIALDKGQAHYVGNVMRRGIGDHLHVFNGRDGEWLGEIVAAGKKAITLRLGGQTRHQEAPRDVMLAFAPIKRGRIDWLVEKAVELGAAKLQPVITQRTIVARINEDRLRSHIVEAAEQCGRTALATLAAPIKLDRWLMEREKTPLYFADETGGEPLLSAVQGEPATLLVGPEGGFTDDERQAIRAAPGAMGVSLGVNILRAETAALAGLATIMAGLGADEDAG